MFKQMTFPSSLKTIFPYLAFLIPVIIMTISYATMGIYWGGDRTLLASDAFSQFSNFHASLNNVMKGEESLFYTWNSSLGLNYWALISYYLGGIFTPLVFFFKNSQIPDAIYFLTLLKIGLAGLSFWYFSTRTFKLQRFSHLGLAVAYALMSPITAHSELIMWLDAFIYLPLIFLGLNRILEKGKPTLLFVSYFLLFVSNYYFGFMIGLLSFLYYFATVLTKPKTYGKTIPQYLITSLLAGGASMVMILPTVLDLSANGDGLSKIPLRKTEATGVADFFIKNMVGVFDTTKYQSIPFIYIGLIPLIFCLFYFLTKKIKWQEKVAYGSIIAFILTSFYFEPLNLFWHGFHSPNMFLFRYSFALSFMMIVLAARGLEVLDFKESQKDRHLLTGISLSLLALFSLTYLFYHKGTYEYVSLSVFLWTIGFVGCYLALLLYGNYRLTQGTSVSPKLVKLFKVALLAIMTVEAGVNTYGVLHGVEKDWNYPTRNLYSGPYPDYSDVINKTKAQDNTGFYRMESLNPTSANESINYNFHSLSQFSSVKNIHSARLMDKLGFRSRGANANTRYENNTLMMDSFFGIKYNLSKDQPQKFGFKEVQKNKTYQSYQNQYALGLGVLAPTAIKDLVIEPVNILSNQTKLINTLTGRTDTFFTYATPTVKKQDNVTIHKIKDSDALRYKEKEFNKGKKLTMEVQVPQGKQVYLKLQPTDFNQIKSSTVEITVNGQSHKTQIKSNGIYYNLGSYDKETKVTFDVNFFGTNEIDVFPPTIVFLDLANYQTAFSQLQDQSADFKIVGRTASSDIEATDNQLLLTTIPFDKGWHGYVNGKKISLGSFNDGLITIPLKKGKNHIELRFVPQGFFLGLTLLILCMVLFLCYRWYLTQQQRTIITKNRKS